MDNDWQKQYRSDIEQRIADLENTLYSAKKQHVDMSSPAHWYGGTFSNLDSSIRYYDIEEYIEFLKTKLQK